MMNQKGQGLIEYTLIVVLVALVFWVAIKNTNVGSALTISWNKVADCLEHPTQCRTGGGE